MKFMRRMVRVGGREPLPVDAIEDGIVLSKALLNMSGRRQARKYVCPNPSSLDGACPREWALGILSERERAEFVHFPMKLMMQIGSAMHRYFQNNHDLFPTHRGYWKCCACDHKFAFGMRPPGRCPGCGALNAAIRYKAHRFRLNEPFYLSGEYDLLLEMAPNRYRIGDIKSCADHLAPVRGSDRLQVQAYMLASKYDKSLPVFVDPTVGYLFYIGKKMNFKAPIRTIKVELSSLEEETLVHFLLKVKRGVDDGYVPGPLPLCKRKDCPFTKECKEFGDRDDFKNSPGLLEIKWDFSAGKGGDK